MWNLERFVQFSEDYEESLGNEKEKTFFVNFISFSLLSWQQSDGHDGKLSPTKIIWQSFVQILLTA